MASECARPMSAKEYAAAIADLGLSQMAAARVLGISGRMSRYYVAGDYEVPQTVATLLRLMRHYHITPDAVAALNAAAPRAHRDQ